MESTGVYWKPVYYVLEDHLPVWVINAEHLRNVPGRKTDVADSVWIAQLIEHGLVSPSFVPPRSVRLLRDLTRHGRRLTEERTRDLAPPLDTPGGCDGLSWPHRQPRRGVVRGGLGGPGGEVEGGAV